MKLQAFPSIPIYLFCLYFCGGAAKIVPEEITPLVPAVPGEKTVDDQTCYILQIVLKFMVVQVRIKSDVQIYDH